VDAIDGQASTQAVAFVPMQGSAITKAISHLRQSEPTVRPTGVGFKRAASLLLPTPVFKRQKPPWL
jgi:hypothetical protein